jgi:hypothetical protein
MEKVFVVRKVTTQLHATEAALDDALLQAADLMRDITNARRDLNVAAVFADEVNVKLMAAMQAVTEARTAMLGVHDGLKEAGLRLGLRTTMDGFGDLPKTSSGLALSEDLRHREEQIRKAG